MARINSHIPLSGCRTTRIYCRPGCPSGKHMKPENRVPFQSKEEATQPGYRAGKICKPDDPLPEPETLFMTRYESPLGTYTIVSSGKGIVSLASPVTTPDRLGRLEHQRVHPERSRRVKYQEGGEYNNVMARELDAYFNGKLTRFTVPFDLRGTPFQLKVWEELCKIPYGETSTYGHIARAISRPHAPRAVGQATGSNPAAIIVPCHRVIGSDGTLTGYASGLERKQYLLNLEARTIGKKLTW